MVVRRICRNGAGFERGCCAVESDGVQAFGSRVVGHLFAALFRAICSAFNCQTGYFQKATAPLRRCLQLLQNPPACAPWGRSVTWLGSLTVSDRV